MAESEDWDPIEVGDPTVEDLEAASRRLVVHFPLSRTAPGEWDAYVSRGLQTLGDPETPKPQLIGTTIIVRSREGERELQDWHLAVKRVVKQANENYVHSVIPDRLAAEEAALAEEADRRRRIEEAQRQIESPEQVAG